MATTEEFKDGGSTSYSFSIEYIKASDIKVKIDGAAQTYTTNASPSSGQYKVVSTTVTLGAAAASGTGNVHIYRETDLDTAGATFVAGSSIRAADLNAIHDLTRLASQEQNQIVTTEDIRDSAVTSAKIKDGTIVDGDISSTAEIAVNKLAQSGTNRQVLQTNGTNVEWTSNVDLPGTLDVSGAADFDNNVTVDGNQTVGGTLGVTGATTLSSLNTSGNTAVSGNLTVGGTFDVTGVSSYTGQQTVPGGALVKNIRVGLDAANEVSTSSGNLILDSTAGTVEVTDNLSVGGNITVTGTVDGRDVATDGGKLDGIETGATADQTLSDISALGAATLTGSETLTNKTLTSPVINDMSGTAVVTSGTSTSDTKTYSAKRAGEIFYGKGTVEEIQSGETWTAADDKVATTSAIDARIIDLVDDVGGFVPIANETSFPNANPDVNNGAGTLVSIKALSSDLTSNGSGVATIANGTVGNSTVTITGLANSTTYLATFGMIVETTTTLNTYTFHRQVPKATEVTTVAGSISNVNTVAGAISNVNAVAGNATNINAVAGNNSNITSVAGNASNINSAVSNASNINSAVSNASNINTTAGSISNVNTVAGSISNVNEVATNMGSVNDFAARYRTGANNPTTSLDVGDLFFNTSANELKVYNGSSWQGGVTASGNFASTTGNTWTGDNLYNDGVKAKFGTDSDLQIYHDGTYGWIANGTGDLLIKNDGTNPIRIRSVYNEENIVCYANGTTELYYDGTKKLNTESDGITVTGNIGIGGDAPNYQVHATTSIGVGAHGFNQQLQIENDSIQSLVLGTGYTTLNLNQLGGNVDIANDSSRLRLGTGQDLQIYHDGSNTYIDNNTGTLNLLAAGDVSMWANNSEQTIKGIANGAVELYFDSNKKFETTSEGVETKGELHFKAPSSSTGEQVGRLEWWNENDAGVMAKIAVDRTAGALAPADLVFSTSANVDTTANGGDGDITERLRITSAGDINIPVDGDKLQFGASQDLSIYHDGSNSYIHEGGTGGLYIRGSILGWRDAGNSNQSWINANSGAGVELYYDGAKKFETNAYGTITNGHSYLYDSHKVQLGSSQDLQIYHDGSNSHVRHTGTGDLYIEGGAGNAADVRIDAQTHIYMHVNGNEAALQATQNGAVDLYYDGVKKLETGSSGIHVAGYVNVQGGNHVYLEDSGKLMIGTSMDMQIFHDGSHSYIDNSTGELQIRTSYLRIRAKDDGEDIATFNDDGAVELYYDGTKSCYTASNALKFDDNKKAIFGGQLQIYHTGSLNIIENLSHDLSIRMGGSENSIVGRQNGSAELYYDNSKKLHTSSGGIYVTGNVESEGNIILNGDNDELRLGASADLKIYHSGVDSYIQHNGGGDFFIRTQGAGETIYINGQEHVSIRVNGNENAVYCTKNGSVYLYCDNAAKLRTTPTGVLVDGGVRLGGDTSSNELQDYEEGSWTPSPNYGSGSGASGSYTKIGNVVHAWGYIHSQSTNSSDAMRINGLPFNANGDQACGNVATQDNDDAGQNLTCYVNNGDNYFYVRKSDSGTWSYLTYHDQGGSNIWYWQLTYRV